jgi:hypothetical protein
MKNDEVCVTAALANRQLVPAEVIVLEMTLEAPGKSLLSSLHSAEAAVERRNQSGH